MPLELIKGLDIQNSLRILLEGMGEKNIIFSLEGMEKLYKALLDLGYKFKEKNDFSKKIISYNKIYKEWNYAFVKLIFDQKNSEIDQIEIENELILFIILNWNNLYDLIYQQAITEKIPLNLLLNYDFLYMELVNV